MGILLLNLIITAALYCGPILFLRFVVFRKKLNKKRALVYVLISTIIVFIGIQVFTDYMYGTTSSNGAPAGFWGFVSYFILADTKKREDAEELPADAEQQKVPSPIQIPEKKPSTKTKPWIVTELQETSEWFKSIVDEIRNLRPETKHNVLRVYSVIVTILTIIFLCLSIKYYNNYQHALSPHPFYRHVNGELQRVIGYYTSSGEFIPFDSED